jgi:hypothetical protein
MLFRFTICCGPFDPNVLNGLAYEALHLNDRLQYQDDMFSSAQVRVRMVGCCVVTLLLTRLVVVAFMLTELAEKMQSLNEIKLQYILIAPYC